MSLIPCKYFARNECRFGDHCRFYHARNAPGNQNIQGGFGSRPLAQSNFNLGQSQHQQEVNNLTAKSQQNMDTMIEMVKRDMVEWERGHIFPFSSYGPTAGKPCLPGFEDISPEELRYRYLQNNKMPLNLTRELSALQESRMTYQQITPATRNILERVIVKGEKIQSPQAWTSPTTQTSSIFGGSGSGGLFGTTPNATAPSGNSLFGDNASIFGGASSQPQTLFAQNQPSVTPGLFSNASQPQPGLFGNMGTTPAQSSSISQSQLFGAGPQQQLQNLGQPSPFQNQPSNFQSPMLQSLLQAPQSQPANTFQAASAPQQPTIGSLFGTNLSPQTQTAPTNLNQMMPPAPGTVFGNPQAVISQSPNVFGGAPPNQSMPGSLFGTPPNQSGAVAVANPVHPVQQTSLFGTTPVSQTVLNTGQKYVYTEESELSQEELEAFGAPNFTIENIPTRPPPRSYCI